jgi:hypothetical protein
MNQGPALPFPSRYCRLTFRHASRLELIQKAIIFLITARQITRLKIGTFHFPNTSFQIEEPYSQSSSRNKYTRACVAKHKFFRLFTAEVHPSSTCSLQLIYLIKRPVKSHLPLSSIIRGSPYFLR